MRPKSMPSLTKEQFKVVHKENKADAIANRLATIRKSKRDSKKQPVLID